MCKYLKTKIILKSFFGVRRDKTFTTNFWLHHFIRGHTNFGKYVVDHINNDKSDNRFCNLRTATYAENGRNAAKKNGTSLYKGVHYLKSRDIIGSRGKQKRCWRATIEAGGKWYTKWCFTEYEAALAYNELAIQHHGEFAKLNVIGVQN